MKTSDGSSVGLGKISLVVAILAVAAGVWHWSGREERATQQESADAVSGQTYIVKCEGCQHTFEMAAPDYVRSLKPEGVDCPQCGKRAARMVRTTDQVDPEDFREEASRITTIAEIKAAAEANLRKLDAVRADLEAAEAAGDTTKAAALKQEKNTLLARDQALNLRWSELQTSP